MIDSIERDTINEVIQEALEKYTEKLDARLADLGL